MQAVKPITKPTKQRRMLYQAPDHIRHKLFAAPLAPELKTAHRIKAFPVRSGDTVRIMRGDHKGFEGKITRIDREKYRIYVEGLTREKVDGTTIFVPVHPSKVMITTLNLDDKWRKKILEGKKVALKKAEEVAEIKEEAIEERVAVEEKPPRKKPKRRKKKAAKKPAEKKMKEKAEEAKKEEKPKIKKARAKRKTTKKAEKGT